MSRSARQQILEEVQPSIGSLISGVLQGIQRDKLAAQQRANATGNALLTGAMGTSNKGQPGGSVAATAAGNAGKLGAALSNTFATPPPALPAPTNSLGSVLANTPSLSDPTLPSIPQGQRLADVMGKVDSLGKTDFSGGNNPVLGAAGQDLTRDAQGNTLATPQDVQKSTTLDDAQQYAGLANTAVGLVNSFRGPQRGPSPLPQAGPTIYTPTANVAQQRLQDLMRLRRGF